MNSEPEQKSSPGSVKTFNKGHPNQQPRPLTADEIETWNGCLKDGIFKVVIPFALVMQFAIPYMLNKGPNVSPAPISFNSIFKKTSTFTLNCFFGLLFYSPFCYSKLQEKFISNEEKMEKERQENFILSKASGNRLESNDEFYQGNLDSKIDGPQSNFSYLNVDYESSFSDNVKLEDPESNEQEKPPKPVTTYDDLRKRNRENYQRSFFSPAPEPNNVRNNFSQNKTPEFQLENVATKERIPTRPKNKYGDDME